MAPVQVQGGARQQGAAAGERVRRLHGVSPLLMARRPWRLFRYEAARGGRAERLASGSDDFTMFLWEPSSSAKPLTRMTGHLQLINQVWRRQPSVCLVPKRTYLWHGA